MVVSGQDGLATVSESRSAAQVRRGRGESGRRARRRPPSATSLWDNEMDAFVRRAAMNRQTGPDLVADPIPVRRIIQP
jgi:hypothetical protein